jgi:hypothetical protein
MEQPENSSENGPHKTRAISWSDYFLYRVRIRGFQLEIIEHIIRNASERYRDTETGRWIAVGEHKSDLILIAYEMDENGYHPVTVHATTRSQIRARLSSGRYVFEL